MAKASKKTKTVKKKKAEAGAARKRLTPRKEKRGPAGTDVLLSIDDPALASLSERVREVGGTPIGAYREPFSGKPLLVAVIPFHAVEPTPFQRDLSPTHTKRLAQKDRGGGRFSRPAHRRASARRTALDAQRPPPTCGSQSARAPNGDGAHLPRRRARVQDPGAQYRKGAQLESICAGIDATVTEILER